MSGQGGVKINKKQSSCPPPELLLSDLSRGEHIQALFSLSALAL